MEQLWRDLSDTGLFTFVRDASRKDVSMLNELVGAKLLPGIACLTIGVIRGVKDSSYDLITGLTSGRIKATISSNFECVPETDVSDIAIIGQKVINRSELKYQALASPDESMKLFKLEPTSLGENISFDMSEFMLPLVAQMVGSGEESLNMAINFAKNRSAFGRPIGSFQALKHKMVNDAIDVELVRSLYLRAVDDPNLIQTAMDLALVKIPKVISDAIQVHGGLGFTADIDLHLHLRRVISIGKFFQSKDWDKDSVSVTVV